MSNKAISIAVKSPMAPAPSFAIFHEECYTFPTAYIKQCVYHGGWIGYDWSCYGRTGKWVQAVDISTVAAWAECVECGKSIVAQMG